MTNLERMWYERGIQIGREKVTREEYLENWVEGFEIGYRKGLLEGIELAMQVRFELIEDSLMAEIARLPNSLSLQVVLRSFSMINSPDELRVILNAVVASSIASG